MDKLLALMAMIFFHFLADYHLQGVLANMKQYEWWKKQVENYETQCTGMIIRLHWLPIRLSGLLS